MLQRTNGSDDYFETTFEKLIKDNWATHISLEGDNIIVDGSIEACPNKGQITCHMLRGVLSSVMEGKERVPCIIKEISCISKGDEKCVFHVGRGL